MTTNKTLNFKSIPDGFPIPGQDLAIEALPFDPTSPPPPGGITLELLYSSFDPYLRVRMRPAHVHSYLPAFDLGGPIINHAVARVLKSDSADYAQGDLLYAMLPIAEYAVLDKETIPFAVLNKITNQYGLKDLGLFLGPLGLPGITAWSSLYEIGKPKKGETIFISSAAGAVGQYVGQLAKREGLRVIGSVGSDDKLDFILNELKFDAGFNYKTEKPLAALERLAPEGIDIYYENVGGEQLEAALEKMNDWGRVVACGMISEYSTPMEQRYGVRNLYHIVARRITMRGFIVIDKGFGDAYGQEHQEKMQKWLADGSFTANLHVTEGIDNAIDGLLGIFKGQNFGKAILKIKGE
ncbi:hypothetical protein QBC37DRAFT_301884 [Rhypophila decipiens]|uniref:Dehydrogenase FUB6 n=1 Tax=Rhypophila decipiens TaxID=261697 RepID=A0AAN7AYA9_9PEZI|nr:hypothetical protein QBC37DRAFT_301884 [Rhypophila decipiens]